MIIGFGVKDGYWRVCCCAKIVLAAGGIEIVAVRNADSVHFHPCRLGNGINWKSQIFPKMRNFTASNSMTGVGNALKRHYQVGCPHQKFLRMESLPGFEVTWTRPGLVSRHDLSTSSLELSGMQSVEKNLSLED